MYILWSFQVSIPQKLVKCLTGAHLLNPVGAMATPPPSLVCSASAAATQVGFFFSLLLLLAFINFCLLSLTRSDLTVCLIVRLVDGRFCSKSFNKAEHIDVMLSFVGGETLTDQKGLSESDNPPPVPSRSCHMTENLLRDNQVLVVFN